MASYQKWSLNRTLPIYKTSTRSKKFKKKKIENTSLNDLDTASLHRNRLLTAETPVRRSLDLNVTETVLWKIVKYTTRLIIKQQKEILAYGLLDRIVELLQAIKEGSNISLSRTI
jgi:hypothetical protein